MLTEGHNQQDFTEIRDLARKLAMSFGVDLNRSRKQLVALHLLVAHFSNTYTLIYWVFYPCSKTHELAFWLVQCSISNMLFFFFFFAVRDGIRFAFRVAQEGEEKHPNIAFLEILSEFSFKLLSQDRAQLWEPERKTLLCSYKHSYTHS